jgi:hypothetical protein
LQLPPIDFGVLVYVIGFLDPFTNDPLLCINLLPNPNSNGCPFIDHGLLIGTCSFCGLNIAKGGYVSTLFICNLVSYRPPCCLYSLSYFSYEDVICGTSKVCLVACTIVGIVNATTFPLIIFCAHASMLSCSFLALNPKAPPSSALFFLLRSFLGNFVVAFFLFSSVVYISYRNLRAIAGIKIHLIETLFISLESLERTCLKWARMTHLGT